MNIFICKTIFQVFFCTHLGISQNDIFVYYTHNKQLSVRESNEIEIIRKYKPKIYIINSTVKIILFTLYLKIIRKNIANIFVSSIDNFFVRTCVSNLFYSKLKTFDDGTINYIPSSDYYKNSYSDSLFYKLLGNNINTNNMIKKMITEHFSFVHLPNIINNVTVININSHVEYNNEVINIYILPYYNEVFIKPDYERSLLKLEEGAIVIPHPRDKNSYECSVENLGVSERLINDFINNGYKVNLIGYPTSVFFNYLNDFNVRIYLIKPHSELIESYKDSYLELQNILLESGVYLKVLEV